MPPKAQKGTPGSCTGSGRAGKNHKKPLPYAWLAVKPNNILSCVGTSVKRKGGYVSRLPFIGFADLVKERKMLLSFFTISRQGTKRVPHNIQGAIIQSNNLRGTLSRESFTRRTTARATRTAYIQRHTSVILQERAYTERTTRTTDRFSTQPRRVLSD